MPKFLSVICQLLMIKSLGQIVLDRNSYWVNRLDFLRKFISNGKNINKNIRIVCAENIIPDVRSIFPNFVVSNKREMNPHLSSEEHRFFNFCTHSRPKTDLCFGCEVIYGVCVCVCLCSLSLCFGGDFARYARVKKKK